MPDARPAPHSHEPLHASLWRDPPRFAASHIVAALAGSLALDAALGWPGQLAGNAWTLGVFAWLLWRGAAPEKRALLACLVLAGLGEAFLSLAWGLYDYRLHNIPVFVPPGHALLMTLGILAVRRCPRWPVWLVPAAALPYVALGLWEGWDTFGALLMLVFLICLAKGKARRLYATMFVFSLVLELYGTWLGNWAWRPLVPVLFASNTNPPLCSGALYCLLDLLVLASMGLAVGGWKPLRSSPAPAQDLWVASTPRGAACTTMLDIRISDNPDRRRAIWTRRAKARMTCSLPTFSSYRWAPPSGCRACCTRRRNWNWPTG